MSARSSGEEVEAGPAGVCTRRSLLGAVASLCLLAPLGSLAEPSARAEAAAKLRPQPGDRLVFASGDRAGRAIAPSEIAPGAAPISAWPMDQATNLIRDGSRLNQVRVLRLEPGTLSAKTAASAVDGIVAYAATCSHGGCDVLGWNAETHQLVCPCHGSGFDALDAAAVAIGPASKPLAMLPLRIEDGVLVVARGFTRAVGFKPQ